MTNIISYVHADFVLLQETHVYSNSQIKVPGYLCFSKCRKFGSKGGVATLISDRFKDHAVLVFESEKSELIVVRICNTVPNIVILNYYGRQEARSQHFEVADDIAEIFKLIHKYSEEGNVVIAAGDWNISLGCAVLVGNHPDESKAGKLVNSLLRDNEDVIMQNLKFTGDCRTHVDASGGRGKCLDLVLANRAGDELITSLVVDTNRDFTPYRYKPSDDSRVYTDHLTVYWEMDRLRQEQSPRKRQILHWNYAAELGDGKFGLALDQSCHSLVNKVNSGATADEVMKAVNCAVKNAKFRGYGIKKLGAAQWKYLEDRKIAQFRQDNIDKAVEMIKSDRKNYRIPLQVFAMRKSILSEKGEMFSSIIHPDTGREVDRSSEIYHATFRHNQKTLKQNEGIQNEAQEILTQSKLDMIEFSKMLESEDPNQVTLTWEEYLEALGVLSARNKSVYDDIKRWGPDFTIFSYMMMKRFYDTEEIPREFSQTRLQALYKNKGSRKDLSNYRFLHLKSTFAKCFEYVVMQKVKNVMYEAFPEAQIGGLPSSRTTEHLYVLMTCMARCETDPETARGFVILFKDVMKAFDKVSAIHGLFGAVMAGVEGKVLRILEKISLETEFEIVGDPEKRMFTQEYCGGQGTIFTCTADSLCMPEKMGKLVNQYEGETGDVLGLQVGRQKVTVNEMEFVDDEASVCGGVREARIKADMITTAMNEMNIQCHPQKTKLMILGSEDYRTEMRKKLKETPVIIQGFEVQESQKEKYLGMVFEAEGSRKTLESQINFRFSECDKKMAQIREILDTPKMRAVGYIIGVKTCYESIIHSTLAYSSGTWLNLNKSHLDMIEKKDKDMLYTLLRVCSKTKLATVQWELQLCPLKYIVWREKLSLCAHLMFNKTSLAGKVMTLETEQKWSAGLVSEVRQWCSSNGVIDPTETPVSSEFIGESVKEVALRDMWNQLVTSRHIGFGLDWFTHSPDYLYDEELTNLEQKCIFKYRCGILNYRGRYKHLHKSKNCPYCGQESDSYQHGLICRLNPIQRPTEGEWKDLARYILACHNHRKELTAELLVYY